MTSTPYLSPEAARAAVTADLDVVDAALARLRATSTDLVGNAFRIEAIARIETQRRTLTALTYRLFGEAADPPDADPGTPARTPGRVGVALRDTVARRLRLSPKEISRRFRVAARLTPRRSLTGQPLPPELPVLAHAVAHGALDDEHVHEVLTALKNLPSAAAEHTDDVEAILVGHAVAQDPDFVATVGKQLAEHLNPDGFFDDRDRQNRRGLTMGAQRPDGMSYLSGWITPELRANLEALGAAHAPGRHTQPEPEPETDAEPEPSPELAPDEPPSSPFDPDPAPDEPEPDAEPAPEPERTEAEPEPSPDPAPDEPPSSPFDPDPAPDEPEPDAEPAPEPERTEAEPEPSPDPAPDEPTSSPFDPDPSPAGAEPTEPDRRSSPQRLHDALTWGLRTALESGTLGTHRGIPLTVIVTTTLQQIEQAARAAHDPTLPMPAPARTAGGSALPWRDLIRMAARSIHYLSVFDDHTGRPLYLGRTQRLATLDQRIICHARDTGCTRPTCTTTGYHCEVMHVPGWHPHGATNADTLYFGCHDDHRLADTGHATLTITDTGRLAWQIDDQPPRTNPIHHPHELLRSPPHDDT